MPPLRCAWIHWYVASVGGPRTMQVELHVDQYDGAVLNRVDVADYPPVAAAVSLGLAFHQGELYGWLSKAQNLLAASLGLLLSVSGFAAWWKRRPAGSLGVPPVPTSRAMGAGAITGVLVLAALRPLVAGSLALVLLIDRFVLQPRGWLQAPALPGLAAEADA